MKLRYYLRGLGTGMLVAALILGRLIGAGRPLTDAEIRAKALTLGMVDANSLSLSDVGGNGEGQQDPSATDPETESPQPDVTEGPDESEDPESSPDVADSPGPEDSPTPPPTLSPSPSPEVSEAQDPDTVEKVTIVISSGEGSYAVCVKLAEAGLVEDAREFDSYLSDNGYSRTIRAGTYKIPVGSSWEEIAGIIA